MADIFHQIGVKVSASQAYNAITKLEGLSSWWTRCTGNPNIDGVLIFHFGEHIVRMTIKELVPDRKVTWLCSVESGEWKDTQITFDLVESGEQIFINFSHTRWATQSELCSHCSTKWAVFLISLKQYLETGKGQPFPEDIPINHNDG